MSLKLKGASRSQTSTTKNLKDKKTEVANELAETCAQLAVAKREADAARIRYYQACCANERAQSLLTSLSKKKMRLESYQKDLTNQLVEGKWYTYSSGWSDRDIKVLVYITKLRRPRKYTYVQGYQVKPAKQLDRWGERSGDIQEGVFCVRYFEGQYTPLTGVLQEETEQGRMAILLEWGISADKLIRLIDEQVEKRALVPKKLTKGHPWYTISRTPEITIALEPETKQD